MQTLSCLVYLISKEKSNKNPFKGVWTYEINNTKMALVEYLNDNILEYGNHIYGDYDFDNLSTDLNYFVSSGDDFVNFLSINALIKQLNKEWKTVNSLKQVDNIVFNSFQNIVDIDCTAIQRRDRSTIYNFISKILKRKPITHDKHIIVLRNFDGINMKFQSVFRTIIDNSLSNSCFIIGSGKIGLVNRCIRDQCCFIRVPSFNLNNLTNLLSKICNKHQISSVNIDSVIENCKSDLYTSLIEIQKLHEEDKEDSTYENLFESAIIDMIKFFKNSKSLEKVIDKIRLTMNKLLHYSLSDGWICCIILEEAMKIPKIKKQRQKCIELIADCEHKLLSTGKKIFIYEYMLLCIYQMI